MLDYEILKRKGNAIKYIDNNSVEFKDLLCKTITEGVNINEYDLVVVSKDYVARPDLISLAIYKTDEYADIICKVNGISNPFELNEDMVLLCPSVMQINKILQNGTSDVMKNDSNMQLISSSSIKKSNLDKAKETISKQSANQLQKQKTDRRSPAEQTIMDNNYIIDRSLGIVIY